jgi:hypothetical protein
MERMYFPELWQRFTTLEQYGADFEQQGLYCGYILAQAAHALDHPNAVFRLNPEVLQAAAEHQATMLPTVQLACTKFTLPQARKFFASFSRALRQDPFDPQTGKPTAITERYLTFHFFVNHWPEIEGEFVAKQKTVEQLHDFLARKENLGQSAGNDWKRTEKICNDIGLSLGKPGPRKTP